MKKILIFVLLVFSLTVQAATYYIDVTGHDEAGRSGANIAGQHWLTLTYAFSRCAEGDIIHVNAGDYTVNTSITIPPKKSIEGDGVTSRFICNVPAGYAFLMQSTPASYDATQHISNIKMDGNSLTGYAAIYIYKRSNVEIHHCTFLNFNYMGVGFMSGTDPETGTWSTGNKFYNNTITNCAIFTPARVKGGSGKPALQIDGQDGMLVYNNTIDCTGRATGGTGYCIKGTNGGNGSYNKNVKIYDNVMTAGAYDYSTWDFAIEFWNLYGGNEIYNNTITGSIDVGGYWSRRGGSTYSVWIHDNWIGRVVPAHINGFRGIVIEGDDVNGVIVERNHIENVESGIFFSNYPLGATVNDIRIFYNIFENMGVSNESLNNLGYGIVWASQVTNDDVIDSIMIWNNVISGHVGVNHTVAGIEIPNTGTATNISIRNNIISNFDLASIYIQSEGTLGTVDVLSIENNICYLNGHNNVVFYEADIATNVTNQNNLPQTASSVGINPLFKTSTNFHLQSTSPAVASGIDVGLTLDYDSASVLPPPDRGVYKYVALPVVLPTVVTNEVTKKASVFATGNGNVTSDGGGTLTGDQGICWSTSANPTITDSHVHVAGATGAFTGAITGLAPGGTYHVRAFATNTEMGIAYGEDVTFTTPIYSVIVLQ